MPGCFRLDALQVVGVVLRFVYHCCGCLFRVLQYVQIDADMRGPVLIAPKLAQWRAGDIFNRSGRQLAIEYNGINLTENILQIAVNSFCRVSHVRPFLSPAAVAPDVVQSAFSSPSRKEDLLSKTAGPAAGCTNC